MPDGQGQAEEHHGSHKDLHEACKAAYQAARDAGKTPPFTVTRIELHGENPFSGYKITVGG